MTVSKFYQLEMHSLSLFKILSSSGGAMSHLTSGNRATRLQTEISSEMWLRNEQGWKDEEKILNYENIWFGEYHN